MRNKSQLNGTTVEMTSMHFAAGAGAVASHMIRSNVVTVTMTGFNGTMDEMLVESVVYRDASHDPGSGLGPLNDLNEDEVMGDVDEASVDSEDVDVDHPAGDWLADWRTEFDPRSSLTLPIV
jgi:hypothetical protein